jgi:hypothetical protein
MTTRFKYTNVTTLDVRPTIHDRLPNALDPELRVNMLLE